MKKFLPFMLAVALILSLAACGGGDSTDGGLEAVSGAATDSINSSGTSNDLSNEEHDTTNNNLLYIELPFSPEDFYVAGYSPADGDHLDEVYDIVSEHLPSFPGDIPSGTYYTGWIYHPSFDWPGTVKITYVERGNGSDGISYTVNRQELGEPPLTDKKRVSVSISGYDGVVAAEDYPLVGSPVMPGITYEEALEALQIENIVSEAKTEATTWYDILNDPSIGYFFESQYGETTCRYITMGEGLSYDTQLQISSARISIDLLFRKEILCSVSCTMYYEI